jgi:prepilin-type N-terminal cleavage/methylation domain-containing protein
MRNRVDLRSEQGMTMIELLVVMAMMVVLMAATTSMFVTGSRAQAFMTKQFQAQETLHVAVDRLRTDVNLACGTTASSGTSVSLSEPDVTPAPPASVCDGNSTITWCTSGSGTNYSLYRYTSGSTCTSGTLWATNLTSGSIFTYYAQNSNAGSYSLPLLHLDATVNTAPTSSGTAYRDIDDLAFRNGARS